MVSCCVGWSVLFVVVGWYALCVDVVVRCCSCGCSLSSCVWFRFCCVMLVGVVVFFLMSMLAVCLLLFVLRCFCLVCVIRCFVAGGMCCRWLRLIGAIYCC